MGTVAGELSNMNYSFQPDGKYFVFDEATGKTLQKDLPTVSAALVWLHTERVKREQEGRFA